MSPIGQACSLRKMHRFGLAAVALGVLSACSVSTPPRVATTTPMQAAPESVRISAPEAGSEPQRRFAEALAAALAERGIALSATSHNTLTVSLAQRPANLGVTQANQAPVAPDSWLSTPRRSSMFDRCQARRMDVILVLKGEDQPEPAYAARGGFDYCTLDPAVLDALARQFAQTITTG